MNQQDRAIINTVIESVRETGEQIISLDEVGLQVFRNLYHIAMTLEQDLSAEVIEKGKTIRIFRK